MSELISGKEALNNWYEGVNTEIQFLGNGRWFDVNSENLSLDDFKDSGNKFRLKPRTIMLNGIEVPATFEPREDEVIWVLSDMHNNGYMRSKHKDTFGYAFGAWRTEEEIKQVVDALREVFK